MACYALLGPTASISDPSGYSLFADYTAGSNGSFAWVPELHAGSSSSDSVGTQATWDDDLEDGFDTGYVAVGFDANLSAGTATVTADTDSPATTTYSGATGGSIGSVQIRAGAQLAGNVKWSQLSITFWQGTQQGEALTIGSGPQIDTTESSSGTGEQVLVVTPESGAYDHVTITGVLRMEAPVGSYPAYSDLFAQILIMPAP
jgi:hypothetical protein